MRLAALFLAGLLALGGPATAQSDPTESAQAAMEALRAAGQALEAAQGSRDRVAALTQTVQAYEDGLASLREGLRQATIRERAIEGVFAAQNQQLAQLLGVLQSMQAAPVPALLLHPSGPLGTVRAGMIVSDITPALSHEAAKLKDALQEIAALRELQSAAVATLEDGLSGVQRARTELSQAISERRDLPRRFTADAEAMTNLLNSADTLESFAGGLLSAAVEDPSVRIDTPDIATAQGSLDLPVRGRVIRTYNEADAAGVRRPGWVIATRPLALVTLPWQATIRYLGPLLDYGQVAIVEPGEGVLLVLAGLGRLFGEVGEVLPKGAAIGLMGGSTLASDQGFLISSPQGAGAEASETLYMELRWKGAPVDPAEWFARAEN